MTIPEAIQQFPSVHRKCIVCKESIGYGEKYTEVPGGFLCDKPKCKKLHPAQVHEYLIGEIKALAFEMRDIRARGNNPPDTRAA